MITDKIEVSGNIFASGGFADVRTGTYLGALVAVKTARVNEQDGFMKIRKVSIDAVSQLLGRDSDSRSPAILQRSRALEYPVPPERLEARWGSGGYGERAIHHDLRVDGTRRRDGLYKI